MKAILWLAAFAAMILILGCGTDQVDGEDWDEFDQVFYGDGPDIGGEPLYFKINYEPGHEIDGEIEGYLFAKFDGTYLDNQSGETGLFLEAQFLSNSCVGMTLVTFEGHVEDDAIKGVLSYTGCDVFTFYYTGDLVGGLGR